MAVPEGTGMPFAGYDDFAACVAANSGKRDPDAYCGSIKHAVEDKADTDWLDARPWKNDRLLDAFINDTLADYDMEKIPLEAQIQAMPFFMEEGFLEWFHGMDTGGTPMKIGRPTAWRVREGKVEVRFGVFSLEDEANPEHPVIEEMWQKITEFGTKGTVSVTFAPIEREFTKEGIQTILQIPKMWLQSAGWVGPYAASPGSTVNWVSAAKSMGMPQMKAILVPGDSSELSQNDTKSLKAPLPDGRHGTRKGFGMPETAKVAKKPEHDVPAEEPAMECPDGMHYDAEAMDCVPDEETAMTMEEAIKNLSKEFSTYRTDSETKFSDLRTLVMRLIEQRTKPKAIDAEALLKAIEEPLTDEKVEDKLAAVRAAVATVLPAPEVSLEDRLRAATEGIMSDVKAQVAEAQAEVLLDAEAKFADVRQKMRQPSTLPKTAKPPKETRGGKGDAKSFKDQLDEVPVLRRRA